MHTLIFLGIAEIGLGIVCIGEPSIFSFSYFNYPKAPKIWRVLYFVSMTIMGALVFTCIEFTKEANLMGLGISTLVYWADCLLLRISACKMMKTPLIIE